jgi:DHA1 family bicyclomycin/chloramphenicol resistance-like MFS transporter
MTSKSIRKSVILALLIMTSTLMTMSTDLFSPSLPHLPAYFDTSNEMVKYTISLWVLSYAGLLLFFGPLSERIGRRPVLVGAMLVFTICTIFCIYATSIEQLIIARMFQGAAAGAEGVLVLSIVRDCFRGDDQVRAFSIYRGANAIPPIFMSLLGAYIFTWFGWQANFILLGIVAAIVTVMLWFFLEESGEVAARPDPLRKIIGDYGYLLRSGTFLSFAVIMSTTIAFLVIFPTIVPFVLVEELGFASTTFGYFQAANMVAFIIGSVIANRLAGKLSVARLLGLGIGLVVFGATALFAVVALNNVSLIALGIPLAIIAIGNGPVLATAPALAMNSTDKPTGASAAMLLTITSILASSTVIIEGLVSDGTSWSLAVMLGSVALIALIMYFVATIGKSDAELDLLAVED